MYIILTTAVAVLKRVSRQAKELIKTLLVLLMMMMMMMILVVLDVNTSISFSFVKIRIFDTDFGRATRFLTPSRVELIGKRSIFGLDNTTNR